MYYPNICTLHNLYDFKILPFRLLLDVGCSSSSSTISYGIVESISSSSEEISKSPQYYLVLEKVLRSVRSNPFGTNQICIVHKSLLVGPNYLKLYQYIAYYRHFTIVVQSINLTCIIFAKLENCKKNFALQPLCTTSIT